MVTHHLILVASWGADFCIEFHDFRAGFEEVGRQGDGVGLKEK